MVVGSLLALFLSMQDVPPMPNRPPPLSNGHAVAGVLGQGCDDLREQRAAGPMMSPWRCWLANGTGFA